MVFLKRLLTTIFSIEFYCFKLSVKLFPCNSNPEPVRVRAELRRIHALYRCYTVGIGAALGGTHGVFEGIHAFGQETDKNMGGGIARAFVIAEPVLVAASRQHVLRFEAGGTKIFHMHVFHVAVGLDDDADLYDL